MLEKATKSEILAHQNAGIRPSILGGTLRSVFSSPYIRFYQKQRDLESRVTPHDNKLRLPKYRTNEPKRIT